MSADDKTTVSWTTSDLKCTELGSVPMLESNPAQFTRLAVNQCLDNLEILLRPLHTIVAEYGCNSDPIDIVHLDEKGPSWVPIWGEHMGITQIASNLSGLSAVIVSIGHVYTLNLKTGEVHRFENGLLPCDAYFFAGNVGEWVVMGTSDTSNILIELDLCRRTIRRSSDLAFKLKACVMDDARIIMLDTKGLVWTVDRTNDHHHSIQKFMGMDESVRRGIATDPPCIHRSSVESVRWIMHSSIHSSRLFVFTECPVHPDRVSLYTLDMKTDELKFVTRLMVSQFTHGCDRRNLLTKSEELLLPDYLGPCVAIDLGNGSTRQALSGFESMASLVPHPRLENDPDLFFFVDRKRKTLVAVHRFT